MLRRCTILLLLALLAAPAVCQACSVPVFRYALERWPADRFSAVLFVNGKLSEPQDEVLTELARAADAPAAGLNLAVEKVDVSGTIAKKYRGLWKEREPEAGGKLPWLVIRYPVMVGDEQRVMWAGPLESPEVASLMHSPAREELGKRLMKGEALVFVLIESGKNEADEAAAKLVGEQIPILEKTVKVSNVVEDDPLVEGPALKSKLPVTLAMSLLRVSRSDEREKMFVRMLLRSQSEAVAEDVPVVFPIFGRGRILCALAGSAIVAGNLEDAAGFLAGPCSCQVKELNPGVDVLMAADWDSVIEDREAVAPRILRVVIPQPKIAAGPASRPVKSAAGPQPLVYSVTSGNVHSTVVVAQVDRGVMLKVAIAVMGVVVLLLGFMVLMRRGVGR